MDSESDNTVVVVEDAPETVVVEESGDSGDDATDAVELAVEIQLVERITRAEDAINTLVATVQGILDKLNSLEFQQEMTETEVRQVAEEVEQVAEEAADAVQETVEEVEEASEEIKPDEVPTVRTHPFFRRWGKS